MYYSDYHMHTERSSDSHATLVELGRTAMARGLHELCVTDHWNLVNQQGEPLPLTVDWVAADTLITQSKKILGDSLEMRLGVEVGNGNLNEAAVTQALTHNNLDFAIGSIHNCSESLGSMGIFTLAHRCQSQAECKAVLQDYCNTLEALVKTDGYDVLGHIIYPLRYFPTQFEASLVPHWEQITEILKIVISKGKGIEINTSQGTTVADWKPYLDLYRSLGGEILTTGADSHYNDKVGAGIHDAVELIAQCGFKHICTYRKRMPQFHGIT